MKIAIPNTCSSDDTLAAVVHWPDIPVANSTERYYRKVEAISYGPGFEEEAEPNYSAN